MGLGDVIIEEIVKCFARCKKPKNETKFLTDSILAIMWIQFVNLGFILIFMSLKVRWVPLAWLPELGILNGQYSEYNASWYEKFGTQILTTFLL
jgi:hypothetical protein